MKKSSLYLLGFILLVAAAVRYLDLNFVPPHLSNDEISIAYDAYSIARTGRDEHHLPLPLSFKSHGTYKAPVYAYLLAPLTLILPENNITAKLPSLICGILTVFCIYYISYLLTQNSRLSAISSLLLATSPWHIYTSRMVLEANVALMFLSLGILSFFRNKYFTANLLLVISMYTYHTEWLLAPFLLLLLSLLFMKKSPRRILISLGVSVLLIVPLIFTYLAELNTGARANTEVIWKEARISGELAKQTHYLNKFTLIAKSFLNNYFSYTNPGYLFFTGLNLFPSPGPYEQGLFLWPLIIPFFIGLFKLRKIHREYFLFFIIWLAASPVVTALTHDGNFIRNLVSVLPYVILISLGLESIFTHSRKLFALQMLFLLFTFILFEMVYLVHFPLARAESYQGYRPLVTFIASSGIKYPRLVVDYRFGIYSEYVGVPHLFFGYYNSWDPRIIQNRIASPQGTFYGNMEVTWIDWNRDPVEPGFLYLVSVSNTPTSNARKYLELVRSFVDVSGMPSFEIWQGHR